MNKECVLYKNISKDVVRCLACNHYCTLKLDEVGKCGVRKNVGGKLDLLVYGRALGLNIDPIEKKPLYHFLSGSRIFSFGTAGCNFGCEFCQNWDMSQVKENPEILDMGTEISPRQAVDYCLENNILSIAFTYNEPTIFFEYAYDTMVLAKEAGIKTVFVSNGFESKEALEMITGFLNAINVDLKSFSDDFYRKTCKSRLDPVLENIKYIASTDIWLEITTLVIPGKNDSMEELSKIAEFIKSINPNIPWHISAFHGMYKMKGIHSTSSNTLSQIYKLGKDIGLQHVYVGNIPTKGLENTYCHKCDELLIERFGYNIEVYWEKSGICHNCGEKIAGVWE